MEDKRAVSPALFGLALLLFAMPFVTVSCGSQEIGTYSGFRIAQGVNYAGKAMSGPNTLAIIGILAAIVGVGVAFVSGLRARATLYSLVAGVAGFIVTAAMAILAPGYVMEQAGTAMAGAGSIKTTLGPGLWGAILAFAAAAVFNGIGLARAKNGPPSV
jgi:hypothetical protein